jgi:hypothetical protein
MILKTPATTKEGGRGGVGSEEDTTGERGDAGERGGGGEMLC